jgi:hypothetical protein
VRVVREDVRGVCESVRGVRGVCGVCAWLRGSARVVCVVARAPSQPAQKTARGMCVAGHNRDVT